MAQYITKIRTESGDMQIDYNALANKPALPTLQSIGAAPADHTHDKSDIPDFPTSLPANGGNADTLGGKKPSDFALASEFDSHKHDDTYYTESEVDNLLSGKANTFASGITVLSSHQYGTSLPAAGNKGRIFFVKVG